VQQGSGDWPLYAKCGNPNHRKQIASAVEERGPEVARKGRCFTISGVSKHFYTQICDNAQSLYFFPLALPLESPMDMQITKYSRRNDELDAMVSEQY
jgi:hypothetical protein